jgi:glutamyl-tRNA synthetase
VSLLKSTKEALTDSQFDAESVQNTLNLLLESTGQKPGILFSLIRLAVSWAPFSPSLNDTLATIGHDKVQSRLQSAIEICSRR